MGPYFLNPSSEAGRQSQRWQSSFVNEFAGIPPLAWFVGFDADCESFVSLTEGDLLEGSPTSIPTLVIPRGYFDCLNEKAVRLAVFEIVFYQRGGILFLNSFGRLWYTMRVMSRDAMGAGSLASPRTNV